MKKLLLLPAFILACSLCVSTVSAELLCVKKKAKVKRGSVALSKSVQVVNLSSCPRGFDLLLDTALFKGDKGDPGTPGVPGTPGAKGDPGQNGDDGINGADGQINLESCRSEFVSFSPCPDGSVCTNTLSCGDANTSNGSEIFDYMIHYNWDLDNDSAYVTEVNPVLTVIGSASYPTGLSLSTTSEETFGTHIPSIGIICCLPE